MRPNVLKGHVLPREGKLYDPYSFGRNGEGNTKCSCGVESPVLPSTRARQQWHRDHKDEVREALAIEHAFQSALV